MSDVVKVYKVKDTETGLYRTAGGGWSKTGKTWNNLGHLKSSISGEGYYSRVYQGGNRSDGPFKSKLPPKTWVIIEVVVKETIGNMTPMRDLVENERRLQNLALEHGSQFSDLVDRIEKAGQNQDFQWVLVVDGSWNYTTQTHTGAIAEMLEIIKTLKLKQNKDYKKATSAGSGGAFAFATKQLAMTVRLHLKSPCKGIDIVKYVETNLDEAE